MQNRSLNSFIFDQNRGMRLNWEMRINIILGIARGLLYLHSTSKWIIIHRDLKTSNILLDEKMNPKISDFGLARIVEDQQTDANITVDTFGNMFSEISTRVAGTFGYIAPDIIQSQKISVKSDVYSFGVILLETISGRRILNIGSKGYEHLIEYAWKLWVENKVLDLMDQTLSEVCNADQFVKYINIGLLCVQIDPNDRPTMSNVFTMLDSEAAKVPTPKNPLYTSRIGLPNEASSFSQSDTYAETTSSLIEI